MSCLSIKAAAAIAQIFISCCGRRKTSAKPKLSRNFLTAAENCLSRRLWGLLLLLTPTLLQKEYTESLFDIFLQQIYLSSRFKQPL
jgi:hypothetical protein